MGISSAIPISRIHLVPRKRTMNYNSDISLDWTLEEQLALEEGLAMFASDSIIKRYEKIAAKLPNKTIREVAMRVKGMNNEENRRRKKVDHNLTRKSKDTKEKISDLSVKFSNSAAQPNVSSYASAKLLTDNDDGISFKAIGGIVGELLEQNAQALNQISANHAAFQLQDNIRLFQQVRDNINNILNDTNDTPEVTRLLPPLPIQLTETITIGNSILPTISPDEVMEMLDDSYLHSSCGNIYDLTKRKKNGINWQSSS